MVIIAARISVLLGVVGWLMLVIPELHFLYKQGIPILGGGKYIAFLLMGVCMFISLPVWIVRIAGSKLFPALPNSLMEKGLMAGACILAVFISRSYM